MDFIDLSRKTWLECGLSGPGPADVQNSQDMHHRVVQWVADAYQFVCRIHADWTFLWNAVDLNLPAGEQEFDLTTYGVSDFNYIISLWAHGQPMVMPSCPSTNFGMNAQAGDPGQYVILPNGHLRLDCPTDKATTLRLTYYRYAPRLVNNTDQPLIPDEWQDIIVWRAMREYALYDEDQAKLTAADTNYKHVLVSMESRLLPAMQWSSNPFTGRRCIGGMRSGW